MEKVKNLLREREQYLLKVQEEKEQALKAAPEGTLRINKNRNKVQYYQRNDPKDFNGTYIKEKDVQLAQKLAQKDYDKRVLRAVQSESKAIQKYLSNYPTFNAEQVYENMNKERQDLIFPIQETEEQYVQKWNEVLYQGKGFSEDTPEYYTAKGERVRSKSELIIADLLNREKIPYRYEYPIYIKNVGKVYPDFTVLDVKARKEIYWEHLGMMDDPTYVEKALRKITSYEQNGIFIGDKLILTYETRKYPLNQKLVSMMIKHYLVQ